MKTTAADLIARSIEHDEIARAEWTQALEDDLIAPVGGGREDHAENGDVVEFWGTTDAGEEWRVHLRRR